MKLRPKLPVFTLIILCISMFSFPYLFGTPAPSRNSICEPGGCATSFGGCTDDIFLDGTTPVDHPTSGSNTVGTAGQDFNAFLLPLVTNGKNLCFEPGAYVIKSEDTWTNLQNVTWTGLLGQTIFQQAASSNLAAMFAFSGATTYNIKIQGITFNFNRAGQGAYTCPNGGYVFQITPDGSAGLPPPSNKITILNNEFTNTACQAIEWIAADGIISGNYFHDLHEALFLTGIQTQRITVSNNVVVKTDNNGPNNAGFDLEDRAQNMSITGNIFRGPGINGGGVAIDLEPGNLTTITSNTICCFSIGIQVSGPGATGSVFNTITGNIVTNNAFDGIKVNHAQERGTVITDNTLRDNGGGSTDQTQIFITSSGPDIIVGFNSMIDTRSGNARTQYGIYDINTNNTQIIGNIVDGYRGQGIRIENSFFNAITDNRIIAFGGEAMRLTGTSGQNLVLNNDLLNNSATPLTTGSVQTNIFKGNLGYNPVGKITNFINGAFIGVCGTGTALVSTTVYVACGTDITLTCSGGTVTAIAEQDNLGNQIFSVANCAALPVQGVFIPTGYKIVFTFTVAPTPLVYGN